MNIKAANKIGAYAFILGLLVTTYFHRFDLMAVLFIGEVIGVFFTVTEKNLD